MNAWNSILMIVEIWNPPIKICPWTEKSNLCAEYKEKWNFVVSILFQSMHVTFFFLEKRHIGSAVNVPHQMRGFLVKTVYFDDWKTNNRLKVIWTHIFQLGKLSASTASHHATTTKVTLNFKRRLLTNCNLLTGICLHSQGRSNIVMHFEKPFFLRPMWFYHSADDISLKLVFGNVILRTYVVKEGLRNV